MTHMHFTRTPLETALFLIAYSFFIVGLFTAAMHWVFTRPRHRRGGRYNR